MPTKRIYETVTTLAFLLTISLLATAVSAQAGPDALRGIITPAPEAWQLPTAANKSVSLEVTTLDGRQAFTTAGRTEYLNLAELPKTPFEIAVAARYTGDGTGSLQFAFGDTNPETRKFPLTASFSVAPATNRIGIHFETAGLDPIRGGFNSDGIGNRSLNWPEDFRRIIEATQAKLTPASERWIEARIEVRADTARMYVEDRFMGELPVDVAALAGKVRLQLTADLAISELALRPIEPADSRFEAIPLQNFYNSSALGGSSLAEGALERGSKPIVVDGVPFQIAQPNEQGHDHIDLGTSWVPPGRLAGHFPSRGAGLSARWSGAFTEDGMRTAISIPTARYNAVHLLAASDDAENELPVVTAQFYRNQRGFPQSFTVDNVPSLLDKKATGIKVKLASGKEAQLYRITIPVEPGKLAAFDEMKDLELELTKNVELYRAYPDPFYYSYHGAGLPSSVQVFGVTLEKPQVTMKVTPGVFADTWAAPETPSYEVTLTNTTNKARQVQVKVLTTSYFEQQKTSQTKTASVPANGEATLSFDIKPPSHGYHDLVVDLKDGSQTWSEERGIVWLHEDTRERGDWQRGRGPIFGFWNWRGGHETPTGAQNVELMGMAGAESSSGSFEEGKRVTDEEKAAARKWGMITFKAFGAGDHYITADFAGNLSKEGYDVAKQKFLERMATAKTGASDINRPELMSFFPEPHIGAHSYGTPPQYYGDAPREWSEHEEERFKYFLDGFIEGAKILKEHHPDVNPMLPHGDPLFAVPFVQRSEEARKLFKGIAVDIPVFERLPEQQIHQVSIHRMYFCRDGLNQAGVTDPILAMYEGPSRSAYYGALSDQQLADWSVRDSLLLYAYGVDRQMGGWAPFESASYWGEQHYGGGISHRRPRATPRPALAAFGTMTRHLNRRNYTKWIETGSRSVYDMQFKHYKTGEPMHAIWLIRGTRPITFENVPDPKSVVVYDLMDNKDDVKISGNSVTFTVSSSPVWVYGLSGDEKITLGQADHSDAAPAKTAKQLASLGDGSWSQSDERDTDYEESHADFVKRFPGNMSIETADAPANAGGHALAIKLADKQSREQHIMPYYTTLKPAKPIVIPGKGNKLGLWVGANSDWGRMIYSVRDAKGEKWLSVGTAGAWNCDDIMNESVFAFDGWRYLTFELPSSSGWDSFREAGTVWWGSYGEGDDIVDLPLTLEKIIIERRTGAMYVTDPQPVENKDVLLGDLLVEYDNDFDASETAVAHSKVRMAVPSDVPDLDNPIAKLAAAGTLDPVAVTKIDVPTQNADGTRCMVFFNEAPAAKTYDVWVSPYADGRGALQLGKAWTEPGKEIRGLRPDTPFYIFVVYTDEAGAVSKPSPGFEIVLKDMFAMK